MFFIIGQLPQLLGQQEARQEGIVAGEGDVRLTGQTAVGVQPEVGHAQLIKLHPVPTLHTAAAELMWLYQVNKDREERHQSTHSPHNLCGRTREPKAG